MHPYLESGWRMFKRRKKPFTQFSGDPIQICRQIVEQCFNGHYFQTSLGHFQEFYIRDFGICAQALLNQGYRSQVRETLHFALRSYKKEKKITTSITKDGRCVDYFTTAIDSFAFLFYSLSVLDDKQLVETYRDFLQEQVGVFEAFIEDGLVTKKRSFSGMRDHYKRKSASYDNAMAYFAIEHMRKLQFTVTKYISKEAFEKEFWTGTYYRNDLTKSTQFCSDAQVFPFYVGMVQERTRWMTLQKKIRARKLDDPLPLKYVGEKGGSKNIFSFLASDYEQTTNWIHLGLCYIQVVKDYDPKLAKTYLKNIADQVSTHKTFLEVFDGKNPYKRTLYQCDEGMLWASLFIDLYS
ncbi:MAG: hypothetical protein ACMXYF_01000 [Candidatus Woesearchaeota archaeon]